MKFGVSFYSYQKAFEAGKLDIAGCIAAVAAMGADGIELLPFQTPCCSYPNPTDAELDRWFGLMDKYHTTPVCMDSVLITDPKWGMPEGTPGLHIGATHDDLISIMHDEIRLCNKLGFTIMRSPQVYGIDQSIFEEVLPFAEDHNVNLALEIHVPMKIDGPEVSKYVDFIQRTGTKHASLLPDMALFARTLPLRLVKKVLHEGADPETVRQIVAAYEAQEGLEALEDTLRTRGADEKCLELAHWAARNLTSRPEQIRDIFPYISHFHAKFYDVDENLVEHGIAYDKVIPILKELDFQGYLDSEYEGQEMYLPDETLDEVEQVRRQHQMVRDMLA